MRATLAKMRALNRTQWRYLALAALRLAQARIDLARLSAQEIVVHAQPIRSGKRRRLDLDQVAWAITAVASRVPWRSDCLVQAMAARRWLSSHGLPSQLRLGVGRNEHGAMSAHAWLLHENTPVTGGTFEADERFAKLPPIDHPTR